MTDLGGVGVRDTGVGDLLLPLIIALPLLLLLWLPRECCAGKEWRLAIASPPQMGWWGGARERASDGRGMSDVEEREFQVWRRLRPPPPPVPGEEVVVVVVVVSWLLWWEEEEEERGWGFLPQLERRATQRAVAEMSILVGSSIWWVVRCVGSWSGDGRQIAESFSPSSLVEVGAGGFGGE